MDGWMDGWLDGWMDGWIDGWMVVCILSQCMLLSLFLSFSLLSSLVSLSFSSHILTFFFIYLYLWDVCIGTDICGIANRGALSRGIRCPGVSGLRPAREMGALCTLYGNINRREFRFGEYWISRRICGTQHRLRPGTIGPNPNLTNPNPSSNPIRF